MTQLRSLATAACVVLTGLAVAPGAAAGDAMPLPVPFAERFDRAQLGAEWKADASKGNAVAIRDGALAIDARMNTYAHIERPLGVDFFRATCAIKPAAGITWCTSLFVYWDAGNWCQLGIINRDGGRYYVMEMIDQKPVEYEFGKRAFDAWSHVAIEAGADCIRYLTSEDGKTFKTEAVHRRPGAFVRQPSLLIVGKGHGGPAGYGNADLNNDYKEPGEMGRSLVRDVAVTPLEWGQLRATAPEREAWDAEGHDPAGEEQLAAVDDPTFESVCKYFPAMKWPREVVGVKDHPHDIGVAFDGALQLNDACYDGKQPIGFFEIGTPPYRFGTGKEPCGRRLLNGYMPIVVLTDKHDGLDLEQTVFGCTKGFSADEPLFGYVRLKATNTSGGAKKVAMKFHVQPAADKCPPREWAIDVPAGGSRAVEIRVPFAYTAGPIGEVPAAEFDRRLGETSEYWAKLLEPGSRFEIPEPRVQDAYRAWLAYNFLNVDKRDGVYHVCDGAGFYEEVYGYSAALYCRMLDQMGYHKQAEIYLDSLLSFQEPDGLLCVNFGATDMGAALWVMSDHYRITRDAEWLKRVAPKMIAMCRWITEHRKESMKHAHGVRAMVHGLVRWRSYCDFELPVFDYYCNGYLCRGMSEAAGVLAEIGLTDDAARIQAESEAFREDILTSMDAAVITHDGVKMLPIMPDTQALLRETNYTANGYYGLVASCLLESGVLAAKDPRTDLLMNMMRSQGGLVCGVSQFRNMIDHAYTYGYWMTCLQRDEAKRVVLGLYGSLAYGMTRDTYSAVECTGIRTGENAHTLPHTYSGTQQVSLVRNMLLREDGADLWIGQAIPCGWLADGKRVAVKAAPTFFGPVSFAIESHVGSGTINVRIEPPTREPPKTVKVRLRHPNAVSIKGIECKPEVPVRMKDDGIEFTGLAGAVDVVVRY